MHPKCLPGLPKMEHVLLSRVSVHHWQRGSSSFLLSWKLQAFWCCQFDKMNEYILVWFSTHLYKLTKAIKSLQMYVNRLLDYHIRGRGRWIATCSRLAWSPQRDFIGLVGSCSAPRCTCVLRETCFLERKSMEEDLGSAHAQQGLEREQQRPLVQMLQGETEKQNVLPGLCPGKSLPSQCPLMALD